MNILKIPRRQLTLALLALGTFTVGTDAFVVAGVLPAMAKGLGVTPAAAGLSVTLFALVYALGAPLLAALTAGLPRRRLLVAALATLSVANLAAASARQLDGLLASRALAALGAAAYTPAAGALAASLFGPRHRGRALSVVIGGLTLATALGVPLGGLVAHWLSWRDTLAGVGLLALAVGIAQISAAGGQPGLRAPGLGERLAAGFRPGVPATLLLTMIGMTASYTLYPYTLPVMTALGASPPAANGVLFLYGAGALLGNLLCGHATDRWGSERVLGWAYVVMCAAFALLLAAFAQPETRPALLPVAAALWGGSTWSQTPPQQHRLIALAPDAGQLLIALNASAIYLGIGAGAVLGGLAMRADAQTIVLTGLLLAALALALLRRRPPPGGA